MQRKQHQCSSCNRTIKGHRYPWGKNCSTHTMAESGPSITLPVCNSMAACRTTSTVSTCNIIYTTANAYGLNAGIANTTSVASVRLSSAYTKSTPSAAVSQMDQDQLIRIQQEQINRMEQQLQEQHERQQQQHKHPQVQPQQDTITEVLTQLQRQQSQIDKLIQHQLHRTDVNTGDAQHTAPVTATTTYAESNVRQDVINVMPTADPARVPGTSHSGAEHPPPIVATPHQQHAGHTLPSLTDIRQGSLQLGFKPHHGPTASATSSTENQYTSSPRGKPNSNLLWPNEFIHRAGTAEVPFDRLSLPEVVCGTMRIVSSSDVRQEEKDPRIRHMTDLMIMAEQYKWESVRSLYQEALILIQNGRSAWQTSIKELKEEMLRPWDQLPPPRNRSTNSGRNTPTFTDGNASDAPICNQWNYSKNGCPRKECGLRHLCKECNNIGVSDDEHRAKECPLKN